MKSYNKDNPSLNKIKKIDKSRALQKKCYNKKKCKINLDLNKNSKIIPTIHNKFKISKNSKDKNTRTS